MSITTMIREGFCYIEPLTCRFTVDLWVQIGNMVGTWFAGLMTLAAVWLSLWLSLDARRVDLRVRCGRFGERREGVLVEFAGFAVTNRGDRPVTIVAVGWRIGGGPWPWQRGRRRLAGQDVAEGKHELPLRLNHGDKADFAAQISGASFWLNYFMDFVGDLPLDSLRGYVETSTGKMVFVHVDDGIKDQVRHVRDVRIKQAAEKLLAKSATAAAAATP